jgi:hypothetical protein
MKPLRSAVIICAVLFGAFAVPTSANAAIKVKITFTSPTASSIYPSATFTPSATSTSGHTLGNGITATINDSSSPVCTMATDGSYTITFTDYGQCLVTYVDAPTSLTSQGVAHQVIKIAAVTTGGPSVTGFANIGSAVTGAIGTWDGSCTSFQYNWVADGVAVTSLATPNEDGSTDPYTIPSSLLHKHLRLRVTALCTVNSVSVPISRVSPVSLVRTGLRIVTSQPAVSGNTTHGNTLTAVTSGWTSGVTLTYQWYRAGTAISSATHNTYTTTLADVGQHLRVVVSASKLGYHSTQRISKNILIK